MTITITKVLMMVAFVSHMLIWYSDRLITYTPNGRFGFKYLNDNEKLSQLFKGTSLKRSTVSMLLGTFAMVPAFFGYLALCEWMRQFSTVYAVLMLIGTAVFFISVAPHHILSGVIEWVYIKLGRTEEARKAITELFKKTSSTMYVCYIGLLLFTASFFIAVVSGTTNLPQWSCVFNILPLYLVLLPFRLVGTGNLASAIMFLGLFFII